MKRLLRRIFIEGLRNNLDINKFQIFLIYVVTISWLLIISTICYVAVAGKENTVDVIMALCETSPLWGCFLGVLGMTLIKAKSKDKIH